VGIEATAVGRLAVRRQIVRMGQVGETLQIHAQSSTLFPRDGQVWAGVPGVRLEHMAYRRRNYRSTAGLESEFEPTNSTVLWPGTRLNGAEST